MQTTIKPKDLVRTPGGRTVVCVELRQCGFRLVEDIVTGDRLIFHVEDLYLVRSARVMPWPSHDEPV